MPGSGWRSVSLKRVKIYFGGTYKLEEEFATVQFGLVEGVEGTLAALLGLELNDTAALGASVLILKNIYADNITCLAHVVFEVLPLGVPV